MSVVQYLVNVLGTYLLLDNQRRKVTVLPVVRQVKVFSCIVSRKEVADSVAFGWIDFQNRAVPSMINDQVCGQVFGNTRVESLQLLPISTTY